MRTFKLNFSRLSEKYTAKSKLQRIIIIILLSLNFLLFGTDGLNRATNPQEFDTTGFLGEALFINNNGGITNFINLCLTGTYKQANQHPLYIILLTPFASTNISFFINAKIVSLILGLVSLIVLFIIGKKMFGDLVASLAVFAMTLNSVFIEQSTIVASESQLVLFSILTMYFIIKGFQNNKYWALAGIFTGLAFLAKGSALFLLPGFGLSVIITYKLQILKNKYFWSFWFLFIFISSPLLIRNMVVYQNPLFNVNNYIGLYGEDFIASSTYFVYNPKIGASHWHFDQNQTTKNSKSKIESSFSIIEFSQKVLVESKLFLDTLYGSKTKLSTLKSLIPLGLFMFFILGIIRERNTGIRIYIIVTLVTFLLALSLLRPISRYLLPILPIIWIYISFGVFTLLEFLNKEILAGNSRYNLNSLIPYLLIFILILNFGFTFQKKDKSNPLNSVNYPEARGELLQWLRANLKENDVYTFGPNFNWQLERGTWIVPPDSIKEDFSKVIDFIARRRIDYIIIQKAYIEKQHKESHKERFIKTFFSFDNVEGIMQNKQLEKWNLVYAHQNKPVEFLIYKQSYK